jgi:hypothetical protein
MNVRAVCLAIVLQFLLVRGTSAGEITGTVQHRDGSRASGIRVSAETADGMVKGVLTDAKGRFRLTWSTDKKLAKVFLDGDRAATDVQTGADIVLTLR